MERIKEFFVSRASWFSAAAFFILSSFHFYYGIIPAWKAVSSDFPNYYVSSKMLIEGEDLSNIYDDKWFRQKIYDYGISEPGKFSPFPPPTAFIMIPEALLDPISAKRIYLVINLVVLIFNVYILSKISGLRFINSFNIFLLSGAALINNFLFGQFYLIMLLLILLGYLNLTKNNEPAAGIFWGISAALKYFTVIYLPVLIIKKKWKALLSFAAAVILVNTAALFFFGTEVYLIFFRDVLFSHLNGQLSSQSEFAVQFQSWNSFLRNLFIYDTAVNTSPLADRTVLFNFSRIAVYLIFAAVSLFVILKFRKDKNFTPAAVIILSLLAFVLSPASASYHLLLMIFPLALLIKISDENILFHVSIAVLFSLIGFSPFLINKMDEYGLIIKYHRLWLEVILFCVSVVFLLRQRGRGYSFVSLRSEIPKGTPSTGDL